LRNLRPVGRVIGNSTRYGSSVKFIIPSTVFDNRCFPNVAGNTCGTTSFTVGAASRQYFLCSFDCVFKILHSHRSSPPRVIAELRNLRPVGRVIGNSDGFSRYVMYFYVKRSDGLKPSLPTT
jgi:hypothetical protein